MSLPAPDPDAVVAVYEARTLDKKSYKEIVEWSRNQPWGPISIGTVHNWVKKGAEWWSAHQRLNPAAEYAMHRQTIDVLFEELHGAYRKGEIGVDVLVALSVKVLAEHRAATGFATALAAPDDAPGPDDAALAAIAEMSARRRARDRKGIGA